MAAPGSGNAVMSHANAIMRVLKDGLISIFAGCLSRAAGRGNTGLSALPLTGGPRWYGRAGGTRGGRGDVGQQPAHHAIWIREKPDGVPPCDCLFSLTLQPACLPPGHPRVMPSRVPQPVCSRGPDNGRPAASRTTTYLDWCRMGWLCFRPGRPADRVLSRLGAAGSRRAAGGGRL
jgi:hypothetical protein